VVMLPVQREVLLVHLSLQPGQMVPPLYLMEMQVQFQGQEVAVLIPVVVLLLVPVD